MSVIFYFDFGRTIANFALKVCYNLVHFRSLYKGVTLKPDILPTKQSMNLTFVRHLFYSSLVINTYKTFC